MAELLEKIEKLKQAIEKLPEEEEEKKIEEKDDLGIKLLEVLNVSEFKEPRIPEIQEGKKGRIPAQNAEKIHEGLLMFEMLPEKEAQKIVRIFEIITPEGVKKIIKATNKVFKQLEFIKKTSMDQRWLSKGQVSEIFVYILGKERNNEVILTRVKSPEFLQCNGDTAAASGVKYLFFESDEEKFVGTYHTHPSYPGEKWDTFSEMDFSRGTIFAGEGNFPKDRINHLFDMVDPIDGDWSIYQYNLEKIKELIKKHPYQGGAIMPINEIRDPKNKEFYSRVEFKKVK